MLCCVQHRIMADPHYRLPQCLSWKWNARTIHNYCKHQLIRTLYMPVKMNMNAIDSDCTANTPGCELRYAHLTVYALLAYLSSQKREEQILESHAVCVPPPPPPRHFDFASKSFPFTIHNTVWHWKVWVTETVCLNKWGEGGYTGTAPNKNIFLPRISEVLKKGNGKIFIFVFPVTRCYVFWYFWGFAPSLDVTQHP
jgi:hypothetical protein